MTKATASTTTLEQRIGPRGRFTLRLASGDVAIRGVEGDTVRVRALDDRPLSDLFDVEVGDDAFELRQVEGLRIGRQMFSHSSGAELAIEVPHGATVVVETQSADVVASDLSGDKRFRSASGEVTLSRLAGGLDVETVSGEVEIEGAAPLDLTAKSVSGDVHVRVPAIRRLDLGTTSGDIRLDATLTGNGPFAIRSISGDVTIVGRAGFRVEAESITGDLSSDLPSKRESLPGRKVLLIGRSGPTLTFRSVSGDFHVVEPRDAATPLESAPAESTPVQSATVGSAQGASSGSAPFEGVDEAATPEAEAKRLEVLRALERGDISVAQATDQLRELDEVLR
jgi:Putative adhesin